MKIEKEEHRRQVLTTQSDRISRNSRYSDSIILRPSTNNEYSGNSFTVNPLLALQTSIRSKINESRSDLNNTTAIKSSSSSNGNIFSKTLAMYKAQLSKLGQKPLEYIPLADIKAELAVIMESAGNGKKFDEERMDYLMDCMDSNPEYVKEREDAQNAWRLKAVHFCQNIFSSVSIYFHRLRCLCNQSKVIRKLLPNELSQIDVCG